MVQPRVNVREKILEIARALPPAPRVFADLDRRLRDTNSRLDEIAELIKRDTALAAQILRVSNSVAFGGEQRTAHVDEAVTRIGYAEVFRIVGYMIGSQLAERELTYYGVFTDQLREHMLLTAFVCEEVARESGLDMRTAYTAGLMRPLGMLVLDRVAELYPDVQPYHPGRDRDYLVWEGRLFGLTSCEIAGMILTEWRFPSDIVEAVRTQYLLRADDTAHRLACLLNLASTLVADDSHGLIGEMRHWSITGPKLESLGITAQQLFAANTRAREAFAGFQRKVDAPEPEPEGTPAAAMGAPGGALSPDSCNFPVHVRVVEANDEPPVHTPPTGLIPPADFTTFMRAYQDMVFSTAARLTGNEAQAEDISQEVFIKAHEHFDMLRTSPTAGGWLKTVATNLSLNHLSRYRNRWKFFSEFKRETAEGDAADVEFAAPDRFFADVDAGERRAWVERALDQLPEHQRVPLVLYHFEDLPYEDIAQKLGISLAKVKTDILRARAALAKILARSGTTHETLSA